MVDAPDWLVRRGDLDATMATSGDPHAVALVCGTMRSLLYAPRGSDDQQPHKRDELYIIASGAADFIRDGECVAVTTNDMLFVPAGMAHRFAAMTSDFAAWVVFWGPDGGERGDALSAERGR